MDFCKRLIDLRQERNLIQADIAKAIGMSTGSVSKYELGQNEPNLETLVQLAAFFNVSIDYLLGVSSVRNPYTSENFTPLEAEIIFRYRRLNPVNKVRLDERINAMLEHQGSV